MNFTLLRVRGGGGCVGLSFGLLAGRAWKVVVVLKFKSFKRHEQEYVVHQSFVGLHKNSHVMVGERVQLKVHICAQKGKANKKLKNLSTPT